MSEVDEDFKKFMRFKPLMSEMRRIELELRLYELADELKTIPTYIDARGELRPW